MFPLPTLAPLSLTNWLVSGAPINRQGSRKSHTPW
ncbi:hypothetical protein CGRA01v4_11876 [Colletotrichum graminicola]|nr:hypothetical protein CGRA01v4_11876 [Colletotrichum graminicola]